jgi:glycine betaine/choline ABC-type transport system substrate-binding protein
MTEAANDNRCLTYPIAVRRAFGAEGSIKTLGQAIRFLQSDLIKWKATTEWILANEALRAAQEQYDDGHRDLATSQFKSLCEKAGVSPS